MSALAVPTSADTPLVWAQWYAAQGWAIFPCKGKVPVTKHGFYDASTDLQQIEHWWAQWPTANIGMPLTSTRFALDVDPRNGGDGTLHDLELSYGPLPPTLLAHTGGGGQHHHYTTTRPVKHHAKIGEGLDVQAQGGYVIMPPSIHPDTGQAYCWDVVYGPDDFLPQPAPPWLEALICDDSGTPATGTTPHAVPVGPIPEGRREATLMSIAGAMQRIGAGYDAIRAALDAENRRCTPPLDAADLDRMAQSVSRYAPVATVEVGAPVGWSVAGVNGATITAGINANWQKDLFSKKNGELTQNAFNIGQILRCHEYWQSIDHQLWFDVIRGYAMCGKHQITKHLTVNMTKWFGGEMRLPISQIDLLRQCLEAECQEHPRDLLQLKLHSLPAWDQEPRLFSWFRQITGAEDTPYTQEISRRLPVSMVARALHPGCPYREVIILEGKENIGKSHLVEALAETEWYTILSMSLEGKDSHIMLHKYWLAELSELDSLTRTEEARMKAFITMESDNYVPKYSNVSVSIPRRTIFMGTTNEPGDYLKGQTGNTRYMPIKVGDRIYVDKFLDMRQQIFAEALHYYHGHPETWWHMPDEARNQAADERELRRTTTEFEQPLHEWLEYGRFITPLYDNNQLVVFVRNETSWPEIARWFLKIETPERWKDRSLQLQIATALKALGWHSVPVWKNGRTTRVWQKIEEAATNEVPF